MAPIDSWLPDAGLTSKEHANWGGKPVEHQVLALSKPQILSLLRFAHEANTLPTNQDDYANRLHVDLASTPDVAEKVPQLLRAYQDLQKDGKKLVDSIFPSIVNLAGALTNYTKLAGGQDDTSYYVGLMKCINDYNTAKTKKPQDTAGMKEAKEAIGDFVLPLIKATTKLQGAAKDAHGDVDKIKTEAYNRWTMLTADLNDIKRRMDKGEVSHLETVIHSLQMAQIQQAESYENDASSANAAIEWALCTSYGVLPSSSAVKYGPRASAIKYVIQALESELTAADPKVQASRIVGSNAQHVTELTNAALVYIDATLDTLTDLDVGIGRASSMLTSLGDAVAKDQVPEVSYDANAIASVLASWNQLASLADDFRQKAYTSQPTVLTVEEWVKKIDS